MTTNRDTDQTNTMLGQVDGAAAATPASERALRAIRRGMGMPAPISPDPDPLTQGRGAPKRKVDPDTDSDEVCKNPKQVSKYN